MWSRIHFTREASCDEFFPRVVSFLFMFFIFEFADREFSSSSILNYSWVPISLSSHELNQKCILLQLPKHEINEQTNKEGEKCHDHCKSQKGWMCVTFKVKQDPSLSCRVNLFSETGNNDDQCFHIESQSIRFSWCMETTKVGIDTSSASLSSLRVSTSCMFEMPLDDTMRRGIWWEQTQHRFRSQVHIFFSHISSNTDYPGRFVYLQTEIE
jgi:hypothetical protein